MSGSTVLSVTQRRILPEKGFLADMTQDILVHAEEQEIAPTVRQGSEYPKTKQGIFVKGIDLSKVSEPRDVA